MIAEGDHNELRVLRPLLQVSSATRVMVIPYRTSCATVTQLETKQSNQWSGSDFLSRPENGITSIQ